MGERFPSREDYESMLDAFSAFHGCNIMIIGDVILDKFVFGEVNRISPEAPVPVVEVEREMCLLGGAANVLNNVISLGGKTYLYGVIGNDNAGDEVIRLMREKNCPQEGIVMDRNRKTTIKTRVIANKQQVVRFDKEHRSAVSDTTLERLKAGIETKLPDMDVIIVSDYGKGVVVKEIMDLLRNLVWNSGKALIVDPKLNKTDIYRGASYITPNQKEAERMSRIEICDKKTLCEAGNRLLEYLDCDGVIITRGEKGMCIFDASGDVTDIPAVAREVFDVTGAGDTVIGVLGLGLAAGLSLIQSAFLANVAAGIVVGEIGTAAVSSDKLRRVVSLYADNREEINGQVIRYKVR